MTERYEIVEVTIGSGRTDPRIHCAECGMPADEDGYCTAVDCVRCGKTARG